MMDRINIQTSIIKLKFSAFSDAFFKSKTSGLSFPSVFHQTVMFTTNNGTMKIQHNCACSHWQSQQLFFIGTILLKTFLMSWLNSFQHSAISIPFSRFMMLPVTSFWGPRQLINKASFIFLLLQWDSESGNLLFSQSISWLVSVTCWAIPFFLELFLLHIHVGIYEKETIAGFLPNKLEGKIHPMQ